MDESWTTLATPMTAREFEDAEEPGLVAGVLLRFDDGTEALVGHMNQNGGACDCCRYPGDNDKIAAYRIAWEP